MRGQGLVAVGVWVTVGVLGAVRWKLRSCGSVNKLRFVLIQLWVCGFVDVDIPLDVCRRLWVEIRVWVSVRSAVTVGSGV